jgi:large subunit ribosomal protein L19e
LVKDGFIIKKPQKIHSRSRARRAHEAKQKGRHSGYGILVFCVKSCSAA